jgi:cell wall-associated NlpC family hydrolase
MFKKIILLIIIICSSYSCGGKKQYIITDDQVNREVNSKKDKSGKPVYNTILTNEDKQYFAKKLDVKEDDISNVKLYNFIKAWKGTPYIYGGNTRNGIDCSALMRELYLYVYNKKLQRTAAEMAMDKRLELFKQTDNLREGDLVFFRITDEKIITHVGIYLKNGKFFSANKYGGSEISSLTKPYWKKNFITAGRFTE